MPKILTGFSFTSHTRFAAGIEGEDVQFRLTTDPGRRLSPKGGSIKGFEMGITVGEKEVGEGYLRNKRLKEL